VIFDTLDKPCKQTCLSGHLYYKEFEGTKGVIRIRKSKKTMAKRKSTKRL